MAKESSDWSSISYYLYSGISEHLGLMKNHPSLASAEQIKNTHKAIDIYSEHCIVGSEHLKEMLNEVILKKEGDNIGSNGTNPGTIEEIESEV